MNDQRIVLGLANTTVRHGLAHDAWAKAADQEAALLHMAIGDAVLGIQHGGSTAVLGLIAKPILDVIVAVSDLDITELLDLSLAPAGWQRRPIGDTDGRRYFVKGSPEWLMRNLSLVKRGSSARNEQVRVRDILRAHPDVLARYAALKRELARTFPHDREAYTLGKAGFILEVLAGTFGD